MPQKIFLFSIILSEILLFPLISSAEGLVPCGGYGENPCSLCYFFKMFENIMDFVFIGLVPPVAILMLVIGGLMFFFSAGSPGNLAKAKSVMTSTVLGLIIIYVAWIMVNTFFVIIGVSEWTGLLPGLGGDGWFTINCEIPTAP